MTKARCAATILLAGALASWSEASDIRVSAAAFDRLLVDGLFTQQGPVLPVGRPEPEVQLLSVTLDLGLALKP